jgi:hypothetical protein
MRADVEAGQKPDKNLRSIKTDDRLRSAISLRKNRQRQIGTGQSLAIKKIYSDA